MSIQIADQTRVFIGAVILGLGVGCAYDLFRFLRLVFGAGRSLTFVLDVCFCVIGVGVFLWFSLNRGGGQLRFYLPGGAVLGALLYFITVSPVVMRVYSAVASAIRWVCAQVAHGFRLVAGPLGRAFDYLFALPRGN